MTDLPFFATPGPVGFVTRTLLFALLAFGLTPVLYWAVTAALIAP